MTTKPVEGWVILRWDAETRQWEVDNPAPAHEAAAIRRVRELCAERGQYHARWFHTTIVRWA